MGLAELCRHTYFVDLVIGIVAPDFVTYLQHVMFHAGPLLWRLNMVHHADLDYDLTTGLRFHPIEIVLWMILKLTIIVALGPPVIAVLVFDNFIILKLAFLVPIAKAVRWPQSGGVGGCRHS